MSIAQLQNLPFRVQLHLNARILAVSYRECVQTLARMEVENMMQISARNVLPGSVVEITKGAVNTEITLSLRGGEKIVAVITNSSVERLELRRGTDAFGIIKASDITVGKGMENARLSARNILAGTIAELRDGAVNSEVGIRLPGSTMLIASITKGSAEALDLKLGDAVSAVVKASHVMVGV